MKPGVDERPAIRRGVVTATVTAAALLWGTAAAQFGDWPDVFDPLQLRTLHLEMEPADTYLNTLGALRYRVGDFEGCIDSMTQRMRLEGGNPSDWLFLALAHHGLGNADQARSWFDRSSEWIEDGNAASQRSEFELWRLRREAAATLGL